MVSMYIVRRVVYGCMVGDIASLGMVVWILLFVIIYSMRGDPCCRFTYSFPFKNCICIC